MKNKKQSSENDQYQLIQSSTQQNSKNAKIPKYPQLHQEINNPQALYREKQQKQDENSYNLSEASHPIACVFTFIFKASAFFIYFIMGNFFSDVNTFIIVTALSGIDFWIVKNITGRLLVGLRWWSDFTQEGKQVWIYQSHDKQVNINAVDSAFFWTSQLAGTLTWLVFFVLKVLSFSVFWAMLVLINLVLCFTNLYGFYKCRGQHSKKLQQLKSKYGRQGFMHLANKLI